MTTENIALLKGLSAKMGYLNQRQTLIAQNIANADTPDYTPKDLKEFDFSTVLNSSLGAQKLQTRLTSAGHMSPSGKIGDYRTADQREVYEIAPAGNAVVIEEQVIKSSRIAMDYNLISNLYKKNMGMLKTALGVA